MAGLRVHTVMSQDLVDRVVLCCICLRPIKDRQPVERYFGEFAHGRCIVEEHPPGSEMD